MSDQVVSAAAAPAAAPAPAPAPAKPKKKRSKAKNPFTNGQSRNPSVPVANLYPKGDFPPGMFLPYGATKYASTSDDFAKNSAAEADRDAYAASRLGCDPEKLKKLRHAAEIHREIRTYARRIMKPGADLFTLCSDLENRGRLLCGVVSGFDGHAECGTAFPLGVSMNETAAHWTPNVPSESHVLKADDIVKFDVGYHVDGWLVDSAWTWTQDPLKAPLVEATRESCERAILKAGPDMLMSELGAYIDEIICSYELEDGTAIQPIRNLSGHLVDHYQIHAGKSIPLSCHGEPGVRMAEGELYALETFASTGRGAIRDSRKVSVSHFMLDPDFAAQASASDIVASDARELFFKLREDFSTLAWSPRWLDTCPKRYGANQSYWPALKKLVAIGAVSDYPALVDVPGCMTSQHENTFLLGSKGKEVLTRGTDY